MSREFRVQYLRPGQLLEEQKRTSLIFLPVSPIEWHGPHLAMGVDAFNAERCAHATADKLGFGVVLPTLYMGCDSIRTPGALDTSGIDKDAYVVGMDYPELKTKYRSFYFEEEIFELTVAAYIRRCLEHGYKYIAIINGHGAANQNMILTNLCRRFTAENPGVKVQYFFPHRLCKEEVPGGHADLLETALMLHFAPGTTDFDQLPAPPAKLEYKYYGIVDVDGFQENAPADRPRYLPENRDPRNATAEFGEHSFATMVEATAKAVKEWMAK